MFAIILASGTGAVILRHPKNPVAFNGEAITVVLGGIW